MWQCIRGYSWVFLEGASVPPGFPNLGRISVQKMSFSLPVFTPDLSIRIFFFLPFSFEIEMINTFIHARSSLENHTRFQTRTGKVKTHFQTKTAKKPYPMGWHIPILVIYGSTPLLAMYLLSYFCF